MLPKDIVINEKYIIRHRILLHLKRKVDRKLNLPREMNYSNTEVSQIAKEMNIPLNKLLDYHYACHYYGHLKCTKNGSRFIMGIEEAGYTAAIEEFWLNEGMKEALGLAQMQSVIRTNRLTLINIWVTIFISILILTTQVMSCRRESNKEYREQQQVAKDSVNRSQ